VLGAAKKWMISLKHVVSDYLLHECGVPYVHQSSQVCGKPLAASWGRMFDILQFDGRHPPISKNSGPKKQGLKRRDLQWNISIQCSIEGGRGLVEGFCFQNGRSQSSKYGSGLRLEFTMHSIITIVDARECI